MKHDVAVIDYGVGNLLSVRRGLEQCGTNAVVTSDPDVVRSAPRVVLPGVGAFRDGMAELQRRGLDDVIREVAEAGTPLLGICLGMEMLLEVSDEFGVSPGLGLINGRVIEVPASDVEGRPQKRPHIGWNGLVPGEGRDRWTMSLLADTRAGDAVYFVHSFMAVPTHTDARAADCIYGGHRISAVIAHENVYGCQFHPEKSGEVGLKILRQFCAI